MKYAPFHKTVLLSIAIIVTTVTVTSVHMVSPKASFHTFNDIPSFSPILALPPSITGSSSARPLSSPNTGFQDCLNITCKGIPAFTTEFNVCLRECFAGQKISTGSTVSSAATGAPLILPTLSSAPAPLSSSIPANAPYCIDTQGQQTVDRARCASPTIQGMTLFPSRRIPSKPIDDLIAEFLGVPSAPPHPMIQPPPLAHDPLEVLTALYTVFQRLPEFLKIITESAVITGAAMDQAYQGYRDARIELLNARTQCAEFYQVPGQTPCTVALRSSVYALGKMRISIEPILAQDIEISRRVAALFKDLTDQWDHTTGPNIQGQPSIEIPAGQPFLQ